MKTFIKLFLVAVFTQLITVFFASFLKQYISCLLLLPLIYFIYLLILIIIRKTSNFSNLDEYIKLYLYYYWGFILATIGWDFIIDNNFTKAELMIDILVLACSVCVLVFYSIKNYTAKWIDLFWIFCAICFYFLIIQFRTIINF